MIFWIGYAFEFILAIFEKALAISQKYQDAKLRRIIDFEEYFSGIISAKYNFINAYVSYTD
jgi:hypothetical protein